MVGEQYGWKPLDELTITFMVLEMLVVVMIPGFLLSLAIFPKKTDLQLTERFFLSFGLGLIVPFTLTILNILFDFPLTSLTTFVILFVVSAIGAVIYFYRR